MQRLFLSTDDVPEAERFAYWREAVIEGLGFSAERNKDREIPFEGQIGALIGPSLTFLRYRGTETHVFRRPRDIVQHPMDDYYWVHRERSGERVEVEGRELVTEPGDLVVEDTTLPLVVEAKADHYDHQVWLLPRNLLDPHLPVSQRPRSLALIGSSGVAGIVKAYFDAFASQINRLHDREPLWSGTTSVASWLWPAARRSASTRSRSAWRGSKRRNAISTSI
jgi:hypothetical protein